MNKNIESMLNESAYKDLILSPNYVDLNEMQAINMDLLLRNADKESKQLISEGTLSGDVAQFTPILMPLVRRVYPTLIANEILGVQPMTMPTGYIYALINQYVGDGDTNRINPNAKGVIVKTDTETDANVGDTVNTDAKVIYKEGLYVLCQKGDTPFTVDTSKIGSATVKEVYTNEASFMRILKNYTGPYTTAAAEQLGKDMREMGFTITKKSVEAKSRALKSQYTVEMYQDLKAQHGLLADEELMNLMAYEIQAEIDRDCLNLVNSNAEVLPDTQFLGNKIADYQSGRWEIERYRAQSIRIAKEAAMIGIQTKRGQGNILIVSPKVCTMLEQIGTFKPATVGSAPVQPISGGVAGTFDNRYKVVVDQYALDDYITVLYKGADSRDAMGFFAPYVPLSFTKVTHQDSGQPAVIAKVRYALDTIPGVESPLSNDRAMTYAKTFGVDFSNTVLA